MDLKKKARNPRCSRCRNHGFLAEFRGHAGKCLFAACRCWKCTLITERTRILATHRRISRTEPPVTGSPTPAPTGPGPTTPAPTGTGPTTPAPTGTGPKTPAPTGTGPKSPARNGTGPKTPARTRTGTGPGTPARTGPAPTTPARPRTDPRTPAFTGTDTRTPAFTGTETRTPARTGTGPTRPARPEGQASRDGITDRGPALSPGENVTAEKPQMNTHSGEMLAMPPPFQMFPCPPDSYVFPVVLVNLQPPPPGTVREPAGFPHLPPSVLAYPVEPGALQAASVPFCVSYSPLPWLQEECGPKPVHCPLSNRENDNRTEGSPSQSGHHSGSQESDIIIVDDDFPSKDAA